MFVPKTEKLEKLAIHHKCVIDQLDKLLSGSTNMYIDYANVRPWAAKLRWNIDLKRLKQFLDSFDNIDSVKFYMGTLAGDLRSEEEIEGIKKLNYHLRTKPVKIMNFSVDARGISSLEDKSLLQQFIRSSLLRKYTAETVEYLNRRFVDMNHLGEFFIEDRKCNFDVEIGVDMLLDFERKDIDTFVLWSGDSDFHDPIKKLLENGKKVVLFATARRVSRELNDLKQFGLIIFDIQKIRNFVCWKREIDEDAKSPIKAKEPSCENSKP